MLVEAGRGSANESFDTDGDRLYNRGTAILGGVPLRNQELFQLPGSRCPFRLRFQRPAEQMILAHERLALTTCADVAGGPIWAGIADEVRELSQGNVETFELSAPVVAGCERSTP